MVCVVFPLIPVLMMTSLTRPSSHLIRSEKTSGYERKPCVCLAPCVMLSPVNTQISGLFFSLRRSEILALSRTSCWDNVSDCLDLVRSKDINANGMVTRPKDLRKNLLLEKLCRFIKTEMLNTLTQGKDPVLHSHGS